MDKDIVKWPLGVAPVRQIEGSLMFSDFLEGPRGTVRLMQFSFMLMFNGITELIVCNDFAEFLIWHFNKELDLLMVGSIVVYDLSTVAWYLLPSSISQMKVRTRSLSGLKCRSSRSGDSISRPERSEADTRRISVDGDSPLPELGLGWARRFALAGSSMKWTAQWVITFWVSAVRMR
jgi:hypothetical protein